MLAAAAERTRNLPPHQLEGCSLEEAFLFDELCPPFLQAELPVDTFLGAITSETEEMDLKSEGEATFVIQQLSGMRDLGAEEQQKRVSRLCFLSALIKVHRLVLPIRKLTDKGLEPFAEKHGLDLQMFQHAVSLFFEKRKVQGAVRHPQPADKLTLLRCYIMVAALMACNSEIRAEDVELLRADLKITRKAAMSCCESLGAKISKRANSADFSVRLLTDGKPLKAHLPGLIPLGRDKKKYHKQ